MGAQFFKKRAEFRRWLEKNHEKVDELIVGFYRTNSNKPSITWVEAVEEALCFGWIDSVRRKIDDESYSNRFTRRRAGSNWSAINIKKVGELTSAGLMKPAGIAAFEKRKNSRSSIYAYENEPAQLTREFEREFKANKTAWKFFTSQAPSYQRTMVHWIMRAKHELTRINRLEKTIEFSSNGKRMN